MVLSQEKWVLIIEKATMKRDDPKNKTCCFQKQKENPDKLDSKVQNS